MESCRATNGGAIPISSSLSTSSLSSFSDAPILLLQRWRSKLFLPQFQAAHAAAASKHPARFYEKTQNWAHSLSSLCIARAGFLSFAAKTSSWSADQSPYDVPGMAINEDDVHNQFSTKMSSELGSDDLWSSLSSFMDDEGRGTSAASQSLMGLSTSLFNDVNTFVMDKEDPAEYVPAPAISAADSQLNTQLENVLYVLREVVPGPLVKTGMDKKLLEACSIVSDDIRVQDPLVCLEGKDRLWSWLRTLATTNAQVHLNEIYAERNRALPFKGFIHAVWTLEFPEELQSSLKHPTSSSSKCVERSSLQLNLSGESKLEVDRTGQVLSRSLRSVAVLFCKC